jgi:hypothetical protein
VFFEVRGKRGMSCDLGRKIDYLFIKGLSLSHTHTVSQSPLFLASYLLSLRGREREGEGEGSSSLIVMLFMIRSIRSYG